MLDQSLDEEIVDPRTYADMQKLDAVFTRLRHESPVHWTVPHDYRPFWALTKHADIKEVERQPARFIAEPRSGLFTIDFEERSRATSGGRSNPIRSLPRIDDPDHHTFRAIMEDFFTAASLKGLTVRIEALARTAVDRMEELGGSCDFVRDIAVWYPLRAIMLILGLPASEEATMLRLTQELFGQADSELRRTQSASSIFETIQEYGRYFAALTADRRANPRDDLASVIANALVDGKPIADWDASSQYITMAAAGHDTTSSTIAGGLLALIENPDQLEKLRANPRMMTTAVEEMLRWVTPIRQFMRTATEDYVLRGQTIKAGEAVMMCYPSANRDEDVFVEPLRFKVDRAPNPQLSFGYGPHLCLGLILARMEIKAIFQELLLRLESVELAGDPAWVQTNFVGGLKRLPITYRMKPAQRGAESRGETTTVAASCPVQHE